MKKQQKYLIFICLFLFPISLCWTQIGNKDIKTQKQPSVPDLSASSPLPTIYWNGDGGKGIKIAVLEPSSKGLSENERWMTSMVQSSITGDFQRFSAMTIIDRQNLEKILGEQKQSLSGNYSDAEYISIGKLTNARLILAGSITKTASSYILELAVTDVESGERKASYPPKAISTFALENLTAIKEATAELLRQLGVQLNREGLQALNSTANITQVKAETALAKGIAAQKQGTVVEALSYYIQAANYDSGLVEAANRMNTLSANISSGNIGADTRNDIAWRREWVKRLQETETFFANTIKEPQPYYIVYSTDIQKGKVDYKKETIELNVGLSFYPDFTWSDHINGVLTAVSNGLKSTNRAQVWELDWPAKTISKPSPFGNQTKKLTSTVIVEIINDNRKSIGRQTVKTTYGFEIKDTVVTPLPQWEENVSFPAVNANLITDKLTIRIVSIDGIAAENAARQKKISIMPEREWEVMLQKNPVVKRNIVIFQPQGHLSPISSVAFSPDGNYFISSSGIGGYADNYKDYTIKLWETTTGHEIKTFLGHSGCVNSISFSADGKLIVSGSSDGTVKLWNVNSGREIRTFSGHKGAVISVSFNHNGKYIISVSYGIIKLWDTSTGREFKTLYHSGCICVAFSPDGRKLVSGSFDNFKLWDITTGRELWTYPVGPKSLKFSPDGSQILSGGFKPSLLIINTTTGREISRFGLPISTVGDVDFSPDGKQIVSVSWLGEEGDIKLWDVATGSITRTFTHSWAVSVAFSPDGKKIISGSADSTIKLWEASTGKLIIKIGIERELPWNWFK